MSEPQILEKDFQLGYTYTRTTGPVIGRFLAGLKHRRILGIRGGCGDVIVPPVEYDPRTAEALDELVEVAATGTLETWTWVSEPSPKQPLDHPFAWALIRLDGADTAMLHAVDAGDPSILRVGLRVRVRWSDTPRGHITDILCFEPLGE